MYHNSIILQVFGACDQIITIMLSFTTVFGANIGASDQLSLEWPLIITVLLSVKTICMPNIGASDRLSWCDQITTTVIVLKNYKTKTGAGNQLS